MNTPVFTLSGRHVGTPDLIDVDAGVVGEYEGADAHLDPVSRHRDLRREDAFRSVGLEYYTAVTRDSGNPTALVSRMRAARARARWQPAHERRWTVVPRIGGCLRSPSSSAVPSLPGNGRAGWLTVSDATVGDGPADGAVRH